VAGQFVYTLSCIVNGATRQATSAVTVGASAGNGGVTSGGASGGGGVIDLQALLWLSALLLLGYRNWLSLLPRRL
jgi:hypothetical protein